jgi:serine/threonine protein phosphatase PrpC
MISVLVDQGARPYQEDRHYIEKNFFLQYDLYCVFDGHGNDTVSVFLQMYFKDVLRNELFAGHNTQTISMSMFNACKKMSEILPAQIGKVAGSAALIILESKEELYVANIGDCRALINRGSEALQITFDHKPNLKSEYDRIIAVGGFVATDAMGTPRVNGNLALSRSFGDTYLAPMVTWTPDVFHYVLFPECQYIFVASDGVYDAVQNHEIVNIVNEELSKQVKSVSGCRTALANASQKILVLARNRGSGDNITIIISKRN